MYNSNRNKNFEKGKLMKNIIVTLVLFINVSLSASQKPYIPSYDDRYEEDLKQANANKDYFKEPDDALNYKNYRYIGAHAAERYPRFFTEYIRQEQTILGMLSTGVRGLMLSVYDWSLNWSSIMTEGISVVCSHPKEETGVFRKNGKPLYQTLHYEMNRIFNFLKSHPKAVITILFDDKCDNAKLIRDIKEIISKNNYDPLLKPSDWPAAQQKGEWPTLGWMRKNNKRLVLFTETHRNHTNFTWPNDLYFWENNYGTTDTNVACGEEKESLLVADKKNRSLSNFGCFGAAAITPARNYIRCFDYAFVKKFTTDCQKRRAARGRVFNGYWADHIIESVNVLTRDKRKTAFDYINELNLTPPSASLNAGNPAKS